jgi:lipopolysaccharide heptosyltransferase II
LVNSSADGRSSILQLPNSPTHQFSRILLVRLRQIGDVVFTTPAVRALRQRFPAAHITYVVEPAAAAIVAHNPHINDVIVVARTRGLTQLWRDLALGRRLRARRYDLAIDFHGGPRSSLLTWLSRATVRIGYDVAGRGWVYTRRIARPRELRARHSVENQWDLLAPLDIAAPDRALFPVEMMPDADAVSAVALRLARAGVDGGDRLIVLHVSAGNPFRRWPIAAFAALIALLVSKDPKRRVIVTSGPSERQAAGRVIIQARALLHAAERDRVVSCGDFSLGELRALLDRASLYIGGDSGPLHIAATTAVPIVGLYGPTLPARSAPWRAPHLVAEAAEVDGLPCRPCDQRVCLPGDFRCLTWLHPDQIVQAAERALARAG